MNNGSATPEAGRAPFKTMIKPLIILGLAAALLLGGILAWQTFIGKMMQKGMAASFSVPPTVSTIVTATQSWQSRTEALGSLRAVRGADLAAQASGVVDRIAFQSGNEVRAGAVLLKLKANDDPAKLAQLESAADIAQITYQRDQEQLHAQAISQATVDSDLATLKSARAQVAAQRALIEEKTVRAPFAGSLGIRQVDEGQYLAAGTTVVTLQALDPMFIDFYVPQGALARLKVGQPVSATVDTYPDVRFGGKIASINSKVDSASRNVQVRASFGNAERRLIPGMYASVEVDDGTATQQLTLPQAAITYNPYGDTVFIVKKAGVDANGNPGATVQQRFVQLGDRRGDQVAVRSGLAAGDEVVTAGQMKLRNGSSILINNKITPANDLRPTPPNE